jgi:hypothetical protein
MIDTGAMQPVAGHEFLLTMVTGFGFVAIYYFFNILVSVVAQKFFHYFEPRGILYKIVDFPITLPGRVFDLTVPPSIKSEYFSRKRGYLNKEAICFLLNVILYSLAAYLIFRPSAG